MRKLWEKMQARLTNPTSVGLASAWLLVAVRLLEVYAAISGHHC